MAAISRLNHFSFIVLITLYLIFEMTRVDPGSLSNDFCLTGTKLALAETHDLLLPIRRTHDLVAP